MPSARIVSVPALCAFTHEGRSYVRGEMVEVTPLAASILARAGKVSLVKDYQRRGVTTESQPEQKRRYRRRDMQAAE